MLTLDERPVSAPLLTIYRRQDHHLPPAGGGGDGPHRQVLHAAPALDRGLDAAGRRFRRPTVSPRVLPRRCGSWPFLSEPHARRLTLAYGSRAMRIIGAAASMDDLGERFTGDLTAAEVRYLVEQEWAQTADDVLWRRSKLGLTASAEETAALAAFISALRAGGRRARLTKACRSARNCKRRFQRTAIPPCFNPRWRSPATRGFARCR